jgi:hypothetical protein
MKTRWDRNKRAVVDYDQGDLMLVTADHLPSSWPLKKLDQKWRGPFKVIKKVGEATYELKLPVNWRGNRVFNEGRIKRFNHPSFKNQEGVPTRPEPELVNQTKEEYEVCEILAERGTGQSVEYLVRWERYGPEDDMWELKGNLSHTKGAIRDFKAQGQATKGGEYHVMTSVTEEIKKEREGVRAESSWAESSRTGSSQVELSWADLDQTGKGDEPGIYLDQLSQREMTGGERDSGTRSVSHGGSTELTGKLCQHMMVLIWLKVGADKVVKECMVRALEEWLHRRGISIYTDQM